MKDIREQALNSDQITREYFNEILVEMRHIDAVLPDTSMTLFGQKFETPVMMAALSHLKSKGGEGDGMVAMAQGAKMSGSVNWCGMGEKPQYDAIAAVEVPTIRIIKPYADKGLIEERIAQAEALGALAVGMDTDHAFNGQGGYDNVLGYEMRPQSLKDLEYWCSRTKLPFVVKGVLSAQDAKKCLEAGVSGIVVSHHHGIMRSAVPPLMVLPEIAAVINKQIPIFLDCDVNNGLDVFKALALGADAVSVGRPVMDAILAEGAEGAARVIREITGELKNAMGRTAAATLADIESSMLWHRDGRHF